MKKIYESGRGVCHIPKKLLLVMKLTAILILTLTLNVTATVYSQNTKLSLDMKEASIKEVLQKIEAQTAYRFIYENEKVNLDAKVSIHASNQRVEDILKKLFENEGISYSITESNLILINPSEKESENPSSGNGSVMQQKSITGKVTDSTGNPIPGASLVIKGTTTGTITDANGHFQLTKVPADAVLQISFVGMKTQEIKLGSQSEINVILQEEAIGLEEVVAVGYGTMKKSDLTGSVASVKSEELAAYPAPGAVQALQGHVAGVQIESINGNPGGSMKVRIRGGTSINASSDPIYVVDGFVGAMLPEPEDIESVEVLKDASATAIYGSRGANGVIMITTKKGKVGKTKIEYNGSYSGQDVIRKIDMLDGEQFTAMTQEVMPNYVNQGANTNWQDIIFRQGSIQNHQLAFSGGNQNVNYYLSGSYFDQLGIIDNSSFNKYSVISNININASKNLKIGLNIMAQRATTNGVLTQEGSGGAGAAGVVGSALRYMPDEAIFNSDGTYTTATLGDPIDNPYAIIHENKNNIVEDRLQGNFMAEYELLKNLSFKTTLGILTSNSRTGNYASSLTIAAKGLGQASIDARKNTMVSSENYLTYNTTINSKHHLGIMGGYSYSDNKYENWSAGSHTFITDAVSYWNLGSGAVIDLPSSNFTSSKLASFYSRLNYNFDDKYLVTFNARYDGSSNFSKNHKWAFFPSGAIAWNMQNENFMHNFSEINQWKWRLSYGVTGNQAIASYQTLARLTNVFSVVNGDIVNAVRPSSVANDDLKWESTKQVDLGADIGLFNNRINITADYYRMVTSNLLFSVPLPNYSGYQTQIKNIGKVENKGFELNILSKIFTGAIKYNLEFNISANRNKVLELPDHKDIYYKSGPGHLVSLGNSQVLREGEPVGSFWGYVYNGVYQEGDTFLPGSGFEQVAGGEKYKDISGDEKLDDKDQTIIGNPQPKFIYGFNNELSWKNFGLTIFIQGCQGNDILSYTLLELETLGAPINSTTRALDRWTPTHTNTDVPKRSNSRSQRVSSRWIYNGSYLRVKNVVLGYTIPKEITQRIGVEKVRFYLSGQNIFTSTNYPGFDPEVNYGGSGSNINQGLDYASYPNAKSYTLGVNIGF